MAEQAALAAREALAEGGPPDVILNASVTPVQLLPDSSVFVQEALGLAGIPSFSIHASCLSFLVGLNTAAHFASSGTWRRILVVSSETGTGFRNFDEPESAALIGDGAGAAVVEPGDGRWLGFAMETYPEGADCAEFRGAGTRSPPNDSPPGHNLFTMKGHRAYRLASVHLSRMIPALLDQHGLRASEVDLVVPHQMSGPGIRAFRRAGFHEDQVMNIIADYGNCIAASIPMALAMAVEDGRLKRGDTVLLVGTGAGLSVAAGLMRW